MDENQCISCAVHTKAAQTKHTENILRRSYSSKPGWSIAFINEREGVEDIHWDWKMTTHSLCAGQLEARTSQHLASVIWSFSSSYHSAVGGWVPAEPLRWGSGRGGGTPLEVRFFSIFRHFALKIKKPSGIVLHDEGEWPKDTIRKPRHQSGSEDER